MKNTVKLIAILVAALTLTSLQVKASNSDSTKFVLDGKILKSHSGSDLKCKVELFYNNTIIDSSIIKMNKPFQYNLKKNVWYTVRITKEGYLPLLISLNTEIKNNAVVTENTFYFESHLIHIEDAKNMNQEFIDFPIGLVEVNAQTGRFETTEEFTNNYLATLNNKNTVTDGLVEVAVAKNNNY